MTTCVYIYFSHATNIFIFELAFRIITANQLDSVESDPLSL